MEQRGRYVRYNSITLVGRDIDAQARRAKAPARPRKSREEKLAAKQQRAEFMAYVKAQHGRN